MTAQPAWSPVDEQTGSLLDLIEADWTPFAEDDRNTIARAIRDDALAHDGHVSQNRVRRVIGGRVFHKRVGPVYRALCLRGDLLPDGWEVTEATELGRNGGKPARTYRWVGAA